jgi:hypothetical protein
VPKGLALDDAGRGSRALGRSGSLSWRVGLLYRYLRVLWLVIATRPLDNYDDAYY